MTAALKDKSEEGFVLRPFYLLPILFLIPEFLNYREDLSAVLSVWRVAQLGAAAVLTADHILHREKHLITNLVFLLYGLMTFSAYVNGGIESIKSLFWLTVCGIGTVMYVTRAAERSLDRFIAYTRAILFGYVFANLAVMIFCRGGIASGRIGQTIWLLGGKNVILPYLILAETAQLLYLGRKGEPLICPSTLLLITAGIITSLIAESSTTMLVMFLTIAGFGVDAMIKSRVVKQWLTDRKLFVSLVLIFLFIIFFSQGSFITEMVASILNRTPNFNGRTELWAEAMRMIRESPVFGVGTSLVLDVGWRDNMTHAHDLYLNIAVKYGIPSLLVLTLIIYLVYFMNNRRLPALTVYVMSLYLFASIVEVYPLSLLMLLIFMVNRSAVVSGYSKETTETGGKADAAA